MPADELARGEPPATGALQFPWIESAPLARRRTTRPARRSKAIPPPGARRPPHPSTVTRPDLQSRAHRSNVPPPPRRRSDRAHRPGSSSTAARDQFDKAPPALFRACSHTSTPWFAAGHRTGASRLHVGTRCHDHFPPPSTASLFPVSGAGVRRPAAIGENAALREHRSGIETRVHLHDRKHRFCGVSGGIARSGLAPRRAPTVQQLRQMDIEGTQNVAGPGPMRKQTAFAEE